MCQEGGTDPHPRLGEERGRGSRGPKVPFEGALQGPGDLPLAPPLGAGLPPGSASGWGPASTRAPSGSLNPGVAQLTRLVASAGFSTRMLTVSSVGRPLPTPRRLDGTTCCAVPFHFAVQHIWRLATSCHSTVIKLQSATGRVLRGSSVLRFWT